MTRVWLVNALGGVLAAAPVAAFAQDSEIKSAAAPGMAAPVAQGLPEPISSPLAIDFSNDPVLALAEETADAEAFRSILVAALADSPADREATALERVAVARLAEARTTGYPTLDLNFGTYQTVARDFTNDPGNIVERSRPTRRSDFSAQLQTPVFAFGAIDAAIEGAEARLRAAYLQRDDTTAETAANGIFAWGQVFAYQSLERLLEGYVAAQDGLRDAVERRIDEGVSAESDIAQVVSLRAEGEVQLAQARRRLASAEARFFELTGFPAPDRLKRLPRLDEGVISRDYAVMAAEGTPQVESAEALAEAKRQDARIARARLFPTISAGAELGRYGVLENRDDYDLRGTFNIRYRLLGGGARARSKAASAEADAAVAVADRAREEARRDAAIAWSDVHALEEQLVALESAYRAARQSRDVVVARFGSLRGSLFDVADAQNIYLRAASAYIQALTELDAARYILLARTGRLLDRLGVAEAEMRR